MRRVHILVSAVLGALPALASATPIDSFDCVLEFKSKTGQDDFMVQQRAVVIRPMTEYPRIRGHNIRVTESQIPMLFRHHNTDYSSTIILRHAIDVGAVGRTMEAALWTCGEISYSNVEQQARKVCDDVTVKSNPFQDPKGRWLPTDVEAEEMKFPKNWQMTIDLEVPAKPSENVGKLSMICKHLETSYQ
jgi:hypothetical protein